MPLSKVIRPYKKPLESKWTHLEPRNVNLSTAIKNVIPSEVVKHVSVENNGTIFLDTHRENGFVEGSMNPLVQATHVAFFDHLPLVLTPDIIWHCISNAVSIYIHESGDEILRKTLIDHENKKEILVERLDFVLGEFNPWNEVVEEFSAKIKENTKQNIVELMRADFTTSSKISRVVSQIVIMDTTEKSFKPGV